MHIVEQVEERVNAPRAPGFDGRVAGRQINRNMGQQFALDFLQQLGGGAGYGQNHGEPEGRMNAAGGNGGMTSSLGPQTAIDAAMKPDGIHGLHPGGAYEGGMSMGLGGEQPTHVYSLITASAPVLRGRPALRDDCDAH